MAKPKKKTAKKSPARRKSVIVRRRKSDLDADFAEAIRARDEEHALDMKIRAAFLELIIVTTDAVKAWRENSTAVAACIIQEMQSDADADGGSDAADDDDDDDADEEDPYEGPLYGGLEDD